MKVFFCGLEVFADFKNNAIISDTRSQIANFVAGFFEKLLSSGSVWESGLKMATKIMENPQLKGFFGIVNGLKILPK